jgi:two-component system phosphate regulon sensor histidine kinase PhoR
MARVWRRRNAPAALTEPASQEEPSPEAKPEPLLGLLEHAEEAMLLVDRDVVQWMNPAARLLFPTYESPIGRPLVEVARDHRIDGQVKKARDSGLEEAAELELPVSGRRLVIRAIPLAEGRIALLIEDVSRLHHLQTVRQEFVANLSHEMRTPLAGLDLAAQTLSDQLPKKGDARVFIERIMAESQRLQSILQNLNQLSALDAETIPVDRRPFNVAVLIRELIERYQLRASTAGLSLRSEPIDPHLQVLGDRAKTDQALQNLVDNAIKFTKTGEVVVSAQGEENRIELVVRDTGPGIPAHDLPCIFERFYKVDKVRGGQSGTGLGLSIARHLIELQGGTIAAESTVGAGTVMRIRLPRASLTPP